MSRWRTCASSSSRTSPAYLDGTLPPDVVALVDEHLADCPHCREYLREMRRTIADAGALVRERCRRDAR